MKAALYCRLSEEDRNKPAGTCDSGSIQNQKTMLLQYAMEQGWDVFDIYSDDDYAGADRRRPQFNRLLRDAQQHKFDIVLCKTQSRFTRELELVEKYIHGLFPAWGIRFVSIVDNADTASKGNKKSRQINGLVNEWYLEDMSDNIRSVLDSRRENGFHIGAFALYGYQKDPKQKGRLVIDEEAAAVVREVFTLFSQGYGKTAIARLLNDRGIPNPTEYKRRHGLRYRQPTKKNSTLWKYSAIADMLENEIYIGNMVQGKYGSVSYKTKQNRPRPREQWYRVEGTHEPIIERALWEKVQALREQRVRPFAEGTVGLFSQKARCMYCGYAMRSSKSRGKHYLALHGARGCWQTLARIRAGKPVIIPGDGTSLWTATHADDFAVGFVGLMGNPHALGTAVHITTDEGMTWNQIYAVLASAMGAPLCAAYVASKFLAVCGRAAGYDFEGPLLGDKAANVRFDNTKIKRLVPDFAPRVSMAQGIRGAVEYLLAHPEMQTPDPEFDTWCDRVLAAQSAAKAVFDGAHLA